MVTGQLCNTDTDDIISMSSLTSFKELIAVKMSAIVQNPWDLMIGGVI